MRTTNTACRFAATPLELNNVESLNNDILPFIAHHQASVDDEEEEEEDEVQSIESTELSSLDNTPDMYQNTSNELTVLRHAIETERLQRHTEQKQYHKQITSMQELLSRLQRRSVDEMRALQIRITEFESHGPVQQEKLKVTKAQLRDLHISHSVYLDYKTISPHQQSIREFVAVKVYEMLQEEREQKMALGNAINSLKTSLVDAENEVSTLRASNDRHKKLLLHSQNELSTETIKLQTRNSKLKEDESALSARVKEINTKEKLYDEMIRRTKDAEKSVSDLQQQITRSGVAETTARQERDEAVHKNNGNEQAIEILRLDKMYLQRELETLSDTNRRSEEQGREMHDKISQVQMQREQLYERMENMRSKWKVQHDDKLNDELKRLQNRSNQEIEQIRVHQREAFEVELRGVREGRDLALGERDRVRVQLDEISKSYDVLKVEHQRVTNTMRAQVQHLSNTLTLKEFELDRTTLAYDDAISAQRRAKTELEKVNRKNEVLKSEYYELKSRAERIDGESGAEIQLLRERIQTFETLESEIELTVSCKGSSSNDIGSAKNQNIHSPSVAEIPLSSHRHIHQNFMLSTRLHSKEQELNNVQSNLEEAQEASQRVQAELHESQEQLRRVEQPYTFLNDTIQERDKELRRCQTVIVKLKNQLKKLHIEYERLVVEKEKLQSNLHNLLLQNDTLINLHARLDHTHGEGDKDVRTESKALKTLDEYNDSVKRDNRNLSHDNIDACLTHDFETATATKSVPRWCKKLMSQNTVVDAQ